jgi:hypothetical protein
MIFDGATNVRDLESQYNITLPEDSSYETVGGFILNQLGFIPRGGESFEASGYRFTVMDMDHRRVSRVKIKSVKPAEASGRKKKLEASTPAPADSDSGSAQDSETPPRKEIAKARRAASASHVRRDK